MKSLLRSVGTSLALLVFAGCSDCGATLTPTQTNDITLAVDAVVCVLTHVTAPPATIAQDCLGDATRVDDVNRVLAAHLAAEARETQDAGAQ
jgi:hypothetical protein